MFIKVKGVFAALVAVALAGHVFVQASEVIDQPLLVVNGVPITMQAVTERTEAIKRYQPEHVPRHEVIRNLVVEELLIQLADMQGRGPNSPVTQQLIADQIRLGKVPAEVARDPKKIREVVLVFMSQDIQAAVMQQLSGTTTEKEILAQLENVPDEFKQMDAVHYQLESLIIPIARTQSMLQVVCYKLLNNLKFWPLNRMQQNRRAAPYNVRLAREQAEEVLKMVRQGVAFEQVIDAKKSKKLWKKGKSSGTIDELPTVYAREVKKLKLGETVGPFECDDGFHLIRLEKATGPLVVQARHILLKPKKGVEVEKIKQRLLDLRESCVVGKQDFQEQARRYSEDPYTVFKGGNLGWILPGTLGKVLEEEVFALEVGEVSQPVQTEQGWCIIQLVEKQLLTTDHPFWKRYVAKHYLEQRKAAEMVETIVKEIYASAYIQWLDPSLEEEMKYKS